MKYMFFIRMSDLHAITNITHSACYTVEIGVRAGDLTRITLDNNHTAYKHIYLQGIGCVRIKSYPPEIMQPSSSTLATIVSAENQNGATIVKAIFFLCHYYIVWKSNNASEARGQSWNESLKSRWIPGGSCGHTSGTKRKHFAALSSPRPCRRWLQLQPSCGSPQWYLYLAAWNRPVGAYQKCNQIRRWTHKYTLHTSPFQTMIGLLWIIGYFIENSKGTILYHGQILWRQDNLHTRISVTLKRSQIAKFRGQHGAHLGPVGPRWTHVGPMNLAIRGRGAFTCPGASSAGICTGAYRL